MGEKEPLRGVRKEKAAACEKGSGLLFR